MFLQQAVCWKESVSGRSVDLHALIDNRAAWEFGRVRRKRKMGSGTGEEFLRLDKYFLSQVRTAVSFGVVFTCSRRLMSVNDQRLEEVAHYFGALRQGTAAPAGERSVSHAFRGLTERRSYLVTTRWWSPYPVTMNTPAHLLPDNNLTTHFYSHYIWLILISVTWRPRTRVVIVTWQRQNDWSIFGCI